uniref:F-box domain-containing protein n=1 Tax=Mycena chlorophos TaxID=658473 RepID=A0ABQ0L8L9_MYCCL|nr:F-box domain-containing protein [Mycena chlorophos]
MTTQPTLLRLTMSCIVDIIPLEVLHEILLDAGPKGASAFSQTCRTCANGFVDAYFWRRLFCSLFDVPPIGESYDWQGQIARRIRAERDAARVAEISDDELQTVLETLIAVAGEISPESDEASLNVEWLDSVLRKSRILDGSLPPRQSRLADRLRAYVALSLDEETEENAGRLRLVRTQSRCFVYDLRNYSQANSWGPYLDGKVNWTHVKDVLYVVVSNLREGPEMRLPMPPHGLDSLRAYSAPGERSPEDWAGVEGTWHRYISFMDYRDLFAFNFGGALADSHNPAFFDRIHFREATRLIQMQLHLIPRENIQVAYNVPEPTYPDRPPLYFSGTTRGTTAPHITPTVQGVVYMDLEGNIRWKFTSIQMGSPQWTSEGVQLGAVGSAMGIGGNWSAWAHDRDDPVGPFWAWKVSSAAEDDITKAQPFHGV